MSFASKTVPSLPRGCTGRGQVAIIGRGTNHFVLTVATVWPLVGRPHLQIFTRIRGTELGNWAGPLALCLQIYQRARSEQVRRCTQAQNYKTSDLISVLAFNFTMFSQNKNRLRDESVVTKWDQLKQYENDVDRNSLNAQTHLHHDHRQYEQANSLGVVRTFKQLKESSVKTYSSIKSHVTDLYR